MSDETELEEASEVTTNRNKVRKVTAKDTWEHTREPKDGEPKKRNGALILYCEDYGVTGTTSFRYHLKSKHAILVEPKERQVTTTSNQKFAEVCKKFGISEEELRREVLKSVLDKRAMNEALITMISTNNLAFREWPTLHALLKTAM